MAVTATTYGVANIAALKALTGLPASSSGLYYARYVDKLGWHGFDPDAVSGGIAPDSGTGRWFPLGSEVLRANRTYYVRTDGSDSNDGLANTSGGAFLTISKFFQVLASLNKNGFTVTCKIADGTYSISQTIQIADGIGSGSVVIEGNTTTPANVVITSSANIVYFDKRTPTPIELKGFKFTNTGSNSDVTFLNLLLGFTTFKNIDFGATTTGSLVSQSHITVAAGAVCIPVGNYTISGKAAFHILVSNLSLFRDNYILLPPGTSFTLTLIGTPAFTYFLYCFGGTYAVSSSLQTISGSATGIRYGVELNGVISTGGGASYLPGNSAGSTATGGQYV